MGLFRNLLEEMGIIQKRNITDSLSSSELAKLMTFAKSKMANRIIEILNDYKEIKNIRLIVELGSFSNDSNRCREINHLLSDHQYNSIIFDPQGIFDPSKDYTEVYYLETSSDDRYIFTFLNQSDYQNEQTVQKIFKLNSSDILELNKFKERSVIFYHEKKG